jgi:hypothetical protein
MSIQVRNIDGRELTLSSWSEAGKGLIFTASSGMSAKSIISKISKLGWEVVSVDTQSVSRAKASEFDVVAKLETMLAYVDKSIIKTLEDERDTFARNTKNSTDFSKLLEMNAHIESLKNPSVSLETMLEYITTKYNEKHSTK